MVAVMEPYYKSDLAISQELTAIRLAGATKGLDCNQCEAGTYQTGSGQTSLIDSDDVCCMM
jgi:hypothetical protein